MLGSRYYAALCPSTQMCKKKFEEAWQMPPRECAYSSWCYSGIKLLRFNRFLLAKLHMDALNSQPTVGHIKKAIKCLPVGVNGLEATYDEAMSRIDGQEEELRILARKVLLWVTH